MAEVELTLTDPSSGAYVAVKLGSTLSVALIELLS